MAHSNTVSSSEPSECALTDEQYTAMCEWAAQGDLDKVRSLIETLSLSGVSEADVRPKPEVLDPDTGDPQPLCKPSPLVEAAQNGHLNIVKFLVKRFPAEPSFLDHTATVRFSWGSQLHHCTALNVASICGHVGIARVLLEAGSSHDIVDCTGSTPFCEATYHGNQDVMKTLHQYGSDVNTCNDFGWSPLHVAAAEGSSGCEMISHLLEMGAKRDITTPQGYTALHVAASQGRLGVVKLLLQKGFSPMFSEADSQNPHYIPCPLYLAAASGFTGIVTHFTQLKTLCCPPSCEYNALLLLAAKSVDSRMANSKYWKRAFDLKLRYKNEIFPIYLAPIQAYGDRLEFVSQEELDRMIERCRARDTVNENQFLLIELLYQALIIRERCIGEKNQIHLQTVTQLSKLLIIKGLHKEAEALLVRTLELVEKYRFKELEKGYILPQTLEAEVGRWMEHSIVPALLVMSSDSCYIPSFGRYVTLCLKLLKVIHKRDRVLQIKYGCKGITPKYLFETVLLLFKIWLYCNTQSKTTSRSIEECEELGQRLVVDWLYLRDGSTLLHLAVSAPHDLEGLSSYITEYSAKPAGAVPYQSLTEFYANWSFDSLLILALLKWGARSVINRRDAQRSRNLPLHLAAKRMEKGTRTKGGEGLLNILISHGAHPDAINTEGKLPWEMCQNPTVCDEVKEIICGPPRPAALACQAAHRVISEALLYEHMSIAPRIKAFIRLHDRHALS